MAFCVTVPYMSDQLGPDDLDPGSLAQIPVLAAAWHFLEPALRDGDLRAAWPAVHSDYRTCMGQNWLHANRQQLSENRYDRNHVLACLVEDDSNHPLWHHFERVMIRSIREVFSNLNDDYDELGIGTKPRLIAPDVEVLYVHDLGALTGGVWQPGATSYVVPLVMRLQDDQWRVLNVGTEAIPEPGWPPRLG